MTSVFSGIVGNTPLIKITDKIYGKLETYSPTGSVKDRMISYIVSDAIASGLISEDTVFCEATSGNTGISLSAVAASLGCECIIFMPSDMSEERRQMMKTFGAKIVDAPPSDFASAIEQRDNFLKKNPKSWSPFQFSNPKNIECHELITGPEIMRDVSSLGKKWGFFVHGAGTGGTFEGVKRFLKNKSSDTQMCLVEPVESPHGIQGIADGKDFLTIAELADHRAKVKTSDAIKKASDFAAGYGIFIGISAGANLCAAHYVEENFNFDGIIVTMLCDRGERYLSIVQ